MSPLLEPKQVGELAVQTARPVNRKPSQHPESQLTPGTTSNSDAGPPHDPRNRKPPEQGDLTHRPIRLSRLPTPEKLGVGQLAALAKHGS